MIIPTVVPGMVSTLLWGYIYNPQNGFLNTVLKMVGAAPKTWLADRKLALPSLLFVGFTWVGGTWMLVYLAGLLNSAVVNFAAASYAGAFAQENPVNWTEGWTVSLNGNLTVWEPVGVPAATGTCPAGTTDVGKQALPAAVGSRGT